MHTWRASLVHTRTRDVTTHPHSKESRPEIQESARRKWRTQVEDDLLAPRYILSRNDETIEPWETWCCDVEWHVLLDQECEQGALDMWGYLEDQAFRGPLRRWDLRSNAWVERRWYVSNVSIIFYCSMLLYYQLWMFMGFIIHFYIIFGTNLLTQSPVPVSVFSFF